MAPAISGLNEKAANSPSAMALPTYTPNGPNTIKVSGTITTSEISGVTKFLTLS